MLKETAAAEEEEIQGSQDRKQKESERNGQTSPDERRRMKGKADKEQKHC